MVSTAAVMVEGWDEMTEERGLGRKRVGEMTEVERRKRGENARHVSARRDVISKDQLQ